MTTYSVPLLNLPAPERKYDQLNEANTRRLLERANTELVAYIERLIVDPVSVADHASSHYLAGGDQISIDWTQITTGVPATFPTTASLVAAGTFPAGSFTFQNDVTISGTLTLGSTIDPATAARITVNTSLELIHGSGVAASTTRSTNPSGPAGGSGWQCGTDDGAAMGAGDKLGFITFYGAYDAVGSRTNQAEIAGLTPSLWSATSRESYLSFLVTDLNSITRVERMRLTFGSLIVTCPLIEPASGNATGLGSVSKAFNRLWLNNATLGVTGAAFSLSNNLITMTAADGGFGRDAVLGQVAVTHTTGSHTGAITGFRTFVNVSGAGGSSSDVSGFNASVWCTGGTTVALHGLKIGDFSISGTVTTAYGIRVGNVSGAATNFAIHTSAGIVRFGGNVLVEPTLSGVAVFYAFDVTPSRSATAGGQLLRGTRLGLLVTTTAFTHAAIVALVGGQYGTTGTLTLSSATDLFIGAGTGGTVNITEWNGIDLTGPPGATIVTARGLRITMPTSTGVSYGIYLEDVTSAGTAYAFYANAGVVSLGDNLILRSGADLSVLNGTTKFAGGSVITSGAALATTATDGFLYIPTSAGLPTGTPTTQTGTAPIEYDTTNNELMVYNGGWRAINTIAHLRGFATISSPVNTTSATLVDVTGVTTTITLVVTSAIWAVCTFGCNSAVGGGCVIEVALSIDGTDYQGHQRALSGTNDQGIGAVTYYVAGLTAGARIVKLRFRRVSGSGTPQITRANLFAVAL